MPVSTGLGNFSKRSAKQRDSEAINVAEGPIRSILTEDSFAELGIPHDLIGNLSEMGWEKPTRVQADAIPSALLGNDIVAQARTGSGKTGGFGIPLIAKTETNDEPTSLVLTPTRELAIQVANEISQISGEKGPSVLAVYGGAGIDGQARSLEKGIDIVVATPGRAIDLEERGFLRLGSIIRVVLDEADRMLDMGFLPDVERIISSTNAIRQTMLFSATFPLEVLEVASKIMRTPDQFLSDDVEIELPDVEQHLVLTSARNRTWALSRILQSDHEKRRTIVFSNTKRAVDATVERLKRAGISSAALHGDMSQAVREKVLTGFRDGKPRILVATDVAARGLDIEDIGVVINFHPANEPETHVHRIGRTARMTKKGIAWIIATREDLRDVDAIARTLGIEISQTKVPETTGDDVIPHREDLDEISDCFGMIPVRVNVGTSHGASIRNLADYIRKTAKVEEISIGDIITQDAHTTTIGIHRDVVRWAIESTQNKNLLGQQLGLHIAWDIA